MPCPVKAGITLKPSLFTNFCIAPPEITNMAEITKGGVLMTLTEKLRN